LSLLMRHRTAVSRVASVRWRRQTSFRLLANIVASKLRGNSCIRRVPDAVWFIIYSSYMD
jgi:hypothetical protein